MAVIPGDAAATALKDHGLPPTLLPLHDVVHCCTMSDGTFSVRHGRDVERRIYGHTVRFSQEVCGQIAHGTISNLQGVQVKKFAAWIKVNRIQAATSRELKFYVGPVVRDIPVEAFSLD